MKRLITAAASASALHLAGTAAASAQAVFRSAPGGLRFARVSAARSRHHLHENELGGGRNKRGSTEHAQAVVLVSAPTSIQFVRHRPVP